MKQIKVSASLLVAILAMAESHVEDIDSGIEDGTYDATDNTDLEAKRQSIEQANALIDERVAKVVNRLTRNQAESLMDDHVGVGANDDLGKKELRQAVLKAFKKHRIPASAILE